MGEGFYRFCTPTASIGPPPGRTTGSKVTAVEHELNLDVVRAIRVIGPFRLPSAPGPKMAREKQLRPDHPTLFKVGIVGFPHRAVLRALIWGGGEHNRGILLKQHKSWISLGYLFYD